MVPRRLCDRGCARATGSGSDSWTCAPDRWVGTHSLLLTCNLTVFNWIDGDALFSFISN